MRNIQLRAIEMFCDSRNLSPPITNDIFWQEGYKRCNLRQISKFSRPLAKSVYYGSENVPFLGRKIWSMLPNDRKHINNLNAFKNKVK